MACRDEILHSRRAILPQLRKKLVLTAKPVFGRLTHEIEQRSGPHEGEVWENSVEELQLIM